MTDFLDNPGHGTGTGSVILSGVGSATGGAGPFVSGVAPHAHAHPNPHDRIRRAVLDARPSSSDRSRDDAWRAGRLDQSGRSVAGLWDAARHPARARSRHDRPRCGRERNRLRGVSRRVRRSHRRRREQHPRRAVEGIEPWPGGGYHCARRIGLAGAHRRDANGQLRVLSRARQRDVVCGRDDSRRGGSVDFVSRLDESRPAVWRRQYRAGLQTSCFRRPVARRAAGTRQSSALASSMRNNF